MTIIFTHAHVARLDLSAYPHLENWLNACTSRPAWRKVDALRGPYPLAYPNRGD